METVKFVARGGTELVVDRDVARKSGLVEQMVDSLDDQQVVVPLADVDADTLGRVVAYLESGEFEAPASDDELLALVVAANFLDAKALLDAACQEVADRIKGKTPDEIRQIFGLENTYTPEEEAQVRQANAWAFE